jgi:hypothetical protein
MAKRETLKPVRCVCGEEVRMINMNPREWFVVCERDLCWCGPDQPTRRKAVEAWNAVMGKAGKMYRRLRGLCDRYEE